MDNSQERIICRALDNQHLLTQWQADFVNKLAGLHPKATLSEKQAEKLDEISERINAAQLKTIEHFMPKVAKA